MNAQHFTSPPCEIRSFESAERLAKAAALDWLEQMQTLTMAGREPMVALSGGRIAVKFLQAARQVFEAHRPLTRKMQYFWADERCVPPDHPESNYALAAKHFLKPLEVPDPNIHRIPGEFEPELAASTSSRGLTKWTGTEAGACPVLDLVFLGMGEDGHVASLFPGEAIQAMESPDPYRGVTVSKPPPQRVTIGYGVLARADEVWVLVSGEGKEEALRRSIDAAKSTPLGRVLSSRASTLIYTDLSYTQASAG